MVDSPRFTVVYENTFVIFPSKRLGACFAPSTTCVRKKSSTYTHKTGLAKSMGKNNSDAKCKNVYNNTSTCDLHNDFSSLRLSRFVRRKITAGDHCTASHHFALIWIVYRPPAACDVTRIRYCARQRHGCFGLRASCRQSLISSISLSQRSLRCCRNVM